VPRRDRTPLHDVHGEPNARFTTTEWDEANVISLEASGRDVRSALEAGLRAVLHAYAAYAGPATTAAESGRSDMVQGEGEDLADLFLDLIDDFLDQMAFSAHACQDVVIDGVLHRDGGGYVAWGYAAESSAAAPKAALPFVAGAATVAAGVDGIVFRARLAREED
jgi:hypothetical protein